MACHPCRPALAWTFHRPLSWRCDYWWPAWASWWIRGSMTACWRWRRGDGTGLACASWGVCWPSPPFPCWEVGAAAAWRTRADRRIPVAFLLFHPLLLCCHGQWGDEGPTKLSGHQSCLSSCSPTEPEAPECPPVGKQDIRQPFHRWRAREL